MSVVAGNHRFEGTGQFCAAWATSFRTDEFWAFCAVWAMFLEFYAVWTKPEESRVAKWAKHKHSIGCEARVLSVEFQANLRSTPKKYPQPKLVTVREGE